MRVAGVVRVPGDKSISHRALILAALADGTSTITGVLGSADVRSTASALRALGAGIPPVASRMAITGGGLRGLRAAADAIDCGNSGTSVRLLAGVVAAYSFDTRFVGDQSLSRRPMRRIARPLTAMGARVDLERGEGLPMVVHGAQLTGVDWASDTGSAQVKSAILLAGVVAGVPVTVREPAASRDHSEHMLRACGVPVRSDDLVVRLEPVARLEPLALRVPGDPSSAAFLTAFALLAEEGGLTIPGVGLNPTRTGFYRVIRQMGARLTLVPMGLECGEPVGTIEAEASPLTGVTIAAADVPAMIDELPLLACLAARAAGTTTITGAGELRAKESDRIAATVANLRAIGVEADELPDGMVVVGTRAPLRGGVVTHGDHRMAMAFGVLGALPGNDVVLDDPGCVDVSYPNFWTDLRRIAVPAGHRSAGVGKPGPAASDEAIDVRDVTDVRDVVAIDGPAASGKSSTAQWVATRLGFHHIDSGALYRAATAASLDGCADVEAWTPSLVLEHAAGITLAPRAGSFVPVRGGEPLGDIIRDTVVTRHVSRVARMEPVRQWVNALVRDAAATAALVVDGRDIGTVVFPDAPLKIFLVADPWERARRRLLQRHARVPLPEEIAAETERLVQRDARDATQSVQAPDAILIDTTYLTQEEQVERIVALYGAVRGG